MPHTTTVLLLAGGKSTRMGRDKRFLMVEGIPLIQKAYRTAQAAGFPVLLLLSQPEERPRLAQLLGSGAEFLIDQRPGAGPLSALADALPILQTDYALLLAVDYPHLSSPFLHKLADSALTTPQPQAVLPVAGGIPQYACGLYHRSLARGARRAVNSGRRSLKGWVRSLGDSVRLLQPETWQAWADEKELLNWNRPDDLP